MTRDAKAVKVPLVLHLSQDYKDFILIPTSAFFPIELKEAD